MRGAVDDTSENSLALPSALVAAVIAIAAGLLAYYLWHAITTDLYRSFIQGIWLTLAQDLTRGVFYRPVIEDGLYGGTRYFPLHFMALAAVWKAGAGPMGAAFIVQTAAGLLLATGLFTCARGFGLRASSAALVAAAGFTPYFVHQSLQELRCDVLAAALNIWGLALVTKNKPGVFFEKTPGLFFAVSLFTLAFATKVTSPALPVALAAGLVVIGRRDVAWRLLAGLAAGCAIVLVLVHVASSGRALENWQAAMFAGVGAEGTLELFFQGAFAGRIKYSRYLCVLGALGTISLVAAHLLARRDKGAPPFDVDRGPRALALVMTVVFATTTLALFVTLSSPGAVVANQAVEWLEITLLTIVAATVAAPRLSAPVAAMLVAMTFWAGVQDATQAHRMLQDTSADVRQAERDRVFGRISATNGPVFSENAIWPTLAGRTPVVLDAFMFRVIGQARPEFARDLVERFNKRTFALVLLRYPPDEVLQGRAWFEHVALGSDVAQSILDNYRLDVELATDVFAYVPK